MHCFSASERARIQAMLGVQFTLLAACNRSCDALCPIPGVPTGDPFLDTNIAGHACFAVPPHGDTTAWLEHYMYHKRSAPINTSACFVVPENEGQLLVRAGFELTHMYPAGTLLFTAPDSQCTSSAQPEPTPCALFVYYDAPTRRAALRCVGNDARDTHIMSLHGRYGAARVSCMLDSGADCAGSAHGFVSQEFVKQHGLAISKSSVPWVALASGASSPIMGAVTATLKIGPFKQRAVTLLVLHAGVSGVDVILASDWLRANRATLCWDTCTVTIRAASHAFVLSPDSARRGHIAETAINYANAVLFTAYSPDTLSAKQAANLLKKGARSFLLIVQDDGTVPARILGHPHGAPQMQPF